MSENEVLQVHPHDEIVWTEVRCAEMDENLTRKMQEELLEAAAKVRELPVVLDVSKVTFLPSLSIGALVSFLTEFKQAGRRFLLVGLQPPVREVLAVTRLDKIFEIYDGVDDALEQIRLAGQ